ncbi:MAG: ATP-dependent RNA helicase [Paramarteilia canceri]
MKPGVPVFSIHGNLSAKKRCENFDNFLKHNRAVLFATDLASRGLDFPDVHWVIQLDCPEDVETYVHRAGRTARFDSKGSCLCIFTEEEEQPMTERLFKANIPIKMIKTNPDKQRNILGKITTMCTQKEELKERARKAFVGYVKFLNSCKNRKIYDFANMNFEEIAKSMGLPKPPRIRSFEKRLAEKSKKK